METSKKIIVLCLFTLSATINSAGFTRLSRLVQPTRKLTLTSYTMTINKYNDLKRIAKRLENKRAYIISLESHMSLLNTEIHNSIATGNRAKVHNLSHIARMTKERIDQVSGTVPRDMRTLHQLPPVKHRLALDPDYGNHLSERAKILLRSRV